MSEESPREWSKAKARSPETYFHNRISIASTTSSPQVQKLVIPGVIKAEILSIAKTQFIVSRRTFER